MNKIKFHQVHILPQLIASVTQKSSFY